MTIIVTFMYQALYNFKDNPTNNCMHKFRFNILINPYNTLNSINVL